ncbi:MAG: two-component system sensor histidine kinase/response regulator [Halioglobus sp.]
MLAAEDNTVNQMVAEGTLSHLGYQVSIASDGQAAIALLSSEAFDIVLMDCQMPGMDGFEATRYIRAAEHGDQRIPIIGLTAHASAEARAACLPAGRDDVISKWYSIDEVAPVILQWLEWARTKKATQ